MWAAHSHPHPLQRTSDQPVGSVETIVIDCNKLFRLNPSGAPHQWQFPHCLEWSRPRSPQCSDWHHHSCPTRNQIWVKIVSKKVYITQLRPEIGPWVLHLHYTTYLSFSEISHSLSFPWLRSPTYSWKLNSPSTSVSFSFSTWEADVLRISRKCLWWSESWNWTWQGILDISKTSKNYLSQDMGSHSRVFFRMGEREKLFHIKAPISTNVCSHEQEPSWQTLFT